MGGGVGQKVLFKASWNWDCLLLRLKSRSASISWCSLYSSGIDHGNEEGRWVQDFLLLPQGFESFPSDLPLGRWRNLVLAEYSSMFNFRGDLIRRGGGGLGVVCSNFEYRQEVLWNKMRLPLPRSFLPWWEIEHC